MNLVFDLDGTLIFHAQPMASDIANALIALEEKGATVHFATARPLRDTLPVLPKYFWDHTIIGCNGAMISKNQSVIDAYSFDQTHIAKLLSYLDLHKIPYLFDGHANYAISDVPHPFHQHVMALGVDPQPLEVERLKPIVKLLILDDTKQQIICELCDEWLDNYACYPHSGFNCFDIVPASTSKLEAIKRLSLDLEHTICFGNDHNDIAMLEAAKQAYVVGQQISLTRSHHTTSQANLLHTLKSLQF